MCSLTNAIDLYTEEAEKENKKKFLIMEKINNIHIPLRNKSGEIELFDSKEKAEIDRIYHQPDYKGLLKVEKIQ